MLFVTEVVVKQEEIDSVQNLLKENDFDFQVSVHEEAQEENLVSQYITSLVSGCYQKSIEGIENTKVDSKIVRKRTLNQVMRESFFYGANRFGNNFIA